MESYIVNLIKISRKVNISLLKAWKHSGVDMSTYYRAINGAEVKHSTAQKVEDAIYTLQKASKSNRKLAEDYRRFKKSIEIRKELVKNFWLVKWGLSRH